MSSWTTLLALTGFRLDTPSKTVYLAPKLEGLTAPWFAPTGYGAVSSQGLNLEFACHNGSLTIQELRLGNHSTAAKVSCNSKPVALSSSHSEGELCLRFEKPLTLESGQALRVRFS
jgi:hypothetical protein